jgi:hypothetical protein
MREMTADAVEVRWKRLLRELRGESIGNRREAPVCERGRAERMLESRVRRGRKDEMNEPGLFDPLQSLDDRRVDDRDFMTCKVLIPENCVVEDLRTARDVS